MTSPMLELSLVLPTYNERANLAPLLERLTSTLHGYSYEVVVVDDDSPDGTWAEAQRLRGRYPHLRVIRRVGERGLSSAVLRGFREAHGRVIGVMDADHQHDETILPQLMAAAKHAAFAVASRRAKGGGVGSWRWDRRFASWTATLLARLVLNVPLSDPMSGYFLMRQEVFTAIDDGTLRPEGFKILVYLYVQAMQRLGARAVTVSEVPFVFGTRLHGKSKLTKGVIWDYLAMLYDLRRRSRVPQGLVKFAVVGALGVFVNSAALSVLHHVAGLHYLLAAALAIELAIVHNFVLNQVWTFRDRRAGRSRWSRFRRFQLVSLGGMAINLLVLFLLREGFGFPLLLGNLCGIAAAVTYNYIANKLWTWEVVPRDT